MVNVKTVPQVPLPQALHQQQWKIAIYAKQDIIEIFLRIVTNHVKKVILVLVGLIVLYTPVALAHTRIRKNKIRARPVRKAITVQIA